ncbi:MAG TPA: hypothetical protein ENJ12_04445 [Thiolapillus brandeum]|uniref:Uncharacterized protein n=1 Tax=Thiolapillus brandeum TaxID=1076588 RepID=A0A831RX84_9GAMM|nr:hypothetical protein [Thiolapillus brandeum]
MVRQSSDAIRGKDQPMLRERRMFRLLLQSNPNYFGNAAFSHLPARSPVSCNTYYEALSCLGYSPEKRQLAAVISLFRSSGYGAGTRISSAPEYVRFYFSFDGGQSWEDQGCTSVEVRNAVALSDRQYAVSLVLPEDAASFPGGSARLRAILSWNDAPPAGSPDWQPVFGGIMETTVCMSAQSPAPTVQKPTRVTDEVLCGIGLVQDELLVAVVHVEGPGHLSEHHHVTFWADTDGNSTFGKHLGTADMALSSLGSIPREGVDYVLQLPVDLDAYRLDCAENSRTLRVRAILSRSRSGARSKFQCVPTERGCRDASLTIAPRVNAAAGTIALVGGLPAVTAVPQELFLRDMKPASEGFLVQGVPLLRHSYVVEVSGDGVHWRPLLDEVKVRNAQGVIRHHRPDPDTGLFAYLPVEQNVTGVLACWDAEGVGKWRVRLRNFFGAMPLPDSDVVAVHLEERPPIGSEQGTPAMLRNGMLSASRSEMAAPLDMGWNHPPLRA